MWGLPRWGTFRLGCITQEGWEQALGPKGKLLAGQLYFVLMSPQRYDPRHNRWFQIQSLQQEHADLCVCVVGRYIYAVAGRDYHNDLNAVERYDPSTNSWTYVAPLKREVRKHSKKTFWISFPGRSGVGGPDVKAKIRKIGPGSMAYIAPSIL